MDCITKPVETGEELKLANELMAQAHGPDYRASLRWLESCGAGYPGYRREHTRIALYRNEVAAALRLTTETIRLGEARLKTGGIGWVTTAPRHRGKGIGRLLMEDAMRYMREQKYHVSMLFGVADFYHRFGYATTLADYTIILDTGEAAVFKTTLKLRPAKPGDIPAIQRIHNANDADTACSLIRSSAHLKNKWDLGKGLRVLTNGEGKVVAYFSAMRSEDHLRVEEVGVAETGLCGDVLSACARMAEEETVGHILCHAPPTHPLSRFLLQYKSTHQMHILRNGGGMMAFIDVGETLENMIPEWESRIATTALRESRTETTLLVEGMCCRIRSNHGAIDIGAVPGANKLSLSPSELMQLLTGFGYLGDVLATEHRLLTADGLALLTALFPKRTPYVWPFDRF